MAMPSVQKRDNEIESILKKKKRVFLIFESQNLPKFMIDGVKSNALMRSDVTVRSVIAMSAS